MKLFYGALLHKVGVLFERPPANLDEGNTKPINQTLLKSYDKHIVV